MRTVYRKICPVCDGDGKTNVEVVGVPNTILSDATSGGEIIADGYIAYIADDGDLVPLPHPTESRFLKAAGGAWNHAAIHGRLLYIQNLICADCGRQNHSATVHVGSTGCFAGLVLAGVVIVCNLLLFKFHPMIEIIFVWLAMFAPSFLIQRYVRFRYRTKTTRYQNEQCRMCGGNKLLSMASARKNSILCSRCTQENVRIQIVGRS